MKQAKIVAHCLIKNEERFIWYALSSVLAHVDQIIVWDTGSTDNTIEIIKTIKDPKIKLKQLKAISTQDYTKARQAMLVATPKDTTWIMILDGDEVWPAASIKKVTSFCRSHPQYESVVVRSNNLVGDIHHRLPESAGQYQLAGQTGHLNLRFINRQQIPGLNTKNPHGQHGYYDEKGQLIQDRDPKKIKFLDVYYHHATHLLRSRSRKFDKSVIKRAAKFKYELGQRIPQDQIPQIFFAPRPSIIPNVDAPASWRFWLLAAILTPIRRLRRLLITPSSGY